MIEARSTLSTGTWQAWRRLPTSIRLVFAFVALIGIGSVAATAIDTPSTVPAPVNAAVGSAPTREPSVRDPSVPDAGQTLPADDRQQETSVATF